MDLKRYYRIKDGHRFRLIIDHVSGVQLSPAHNPPECAWMHDCDDDCKQFAGRKDETYEEVKS